MSDPLCDACVTCGSRDVLPDAFQCSPCWSADPVLWPEQAPKGLDTHIVPAPFDVGCYVDAYGSNRRHVVEFIAGTVYGDQAVARFTMSAN